MVGHGLLLRRFTDGAVGGAGEVTGGVLGGGGQGGDVGDDEKHQEN